MMVIQNWLRDIRTVFNYYLKLENLLLRGKTHWSSHRLVIEGQLEGLNTHSRRNWYWGMRAFEAICCVPRHVLPWYSVCNRNGSPKTLCITTTTKTVCFHLGVIMPVYNDTCRRSNIVHRRFQHAIFSERYYATAIYRRLCLRVQW